GHFLEIGPDGVLSAMARESLPEDFGGLLAPVLRKKDEDVRAFLTALGAAWTHGLPVAWQPLFPDTTTPPTDLPTYPFQRERYWLSAVAEPAREDDGPFWDAVERQDATGLAGTIGLPDAQPLREVLPALATWHLARREERTLDAWRYRVTWQALPDAATPRLTGHWLVIAPPTEAAEHLTKQCLDALTAHGARADLAHLDPTTADPDAYAELLRTGAPDRLLSLLPLDTRPHAQHPSLVAGLAGTAALIQALGEADLDATLWNVTSGAVSTGPADPLAVGAAAQNQSWALGRVAALEYPDRWGGLIDVPARLDDRARDRLAAALSGANGAGTGVPEDGEDQLALRPGGIFARRLRHAPVPADRAGAPWRPSGTVLVTGGTGALGRRLAHWLADAGAEHLVLASRRGPDAPGAAELAAELTAAGTAVTLAACDAADRAQLSALLDAIPAETPLTAVVHAAGVGDHGYLADVTPEHLAHVLRPKATAADLLHELTADLDLSAFVMFTSSAAMWGSGGQAAYAAANAHLDALAEHRRALGLAATAVAWGPWAESGMAADEEVDEHLRRRGVIALAPEFGIAALQQALDLDDTCVGVADVDWSRFAPSFTALRPSPLIAGLPEVKAALAEAAGAVAAPAEAGAATALVTRLTAADEAEQQHILVELVRSHAAAVLGYPGTDAVPESRPFKELGFDSLGAVELRNRLAAETGLKLSATLLFDHPAPAPLAQYLREHLITDDDAVTDATVIAELDRLDAALTRLAPDDAARRRIAGRLQVLLGKWGTESGPATPDGNGAHDELESATAEEIFALINDELGKSQP
ncbi:SDR family NAD(P)-dependent oxidoreductase, partial [Streptomyces litchfieldiae]